MKIIKLLSVTITAIAVVGLAPAALAENTGKEVVVVNADPIPVTVENSGAGGTDYVSVSASELINTPQSSRVSIEGFNVPAGKIFIVDYVSIYLDIVVRNPPQTGLRIAARLDGNGTNSSPRFELGYMEEFVRTSRGTPNFITAREVTLYLTEGPVDCVADSHFAGSDLDFGLIRCDLSGRLIDAP